MLVEISDATLEALKVHESLMANLASMDTDAFNHFKMQACTNCNSIVSEIRIQEFNNKIGNNDATD